MHAVLTSEWIFKCDLLKYFIWSKSVPPSRPHISPSFTKQVLCFQTLMFVLLPVDGGCSFPWTHLRGAKLFPSLGHSRTSYQYHGDLEAPPSWAHWSYPYCLRAKTETAPHLPVHTLTPIPHLLLCPHPPLPPSYPPPPAPSPHSPCPELPSLEVSIEPYRVRFHGNYFNHFLTNNLHHLASSHMPDKSPAQHPVYQEYHRHTDLTKTTLLWVLPPGVPTICGSPSGSQVSSISRSKCRGKG